MKANYINDLWVAFRSKNILENSSHSYPENLLINVQNKQWKIGIKKSHVVKYKQYEKTTHAQSSDPH